MAIQVWSFQVGVTKLERFLHKNQHTQRKLLSFGLMTSCQKMILSQNVNSKKSAPKLVFFNEKKLERFV